MKRPRPELGCSAIEEEDEEEEEECDSLHLKYWSKYMFPKISLN